MTDISSRAMLVDLTQRAWTGTTTDRAIAAETEKANEAQEGTLKVIKDLTPRSYLSPILHTMQVGRQEHYRLTVPGIVKGQHLLANAMFERYTETQSEIRDVFEERVRDFIGIYPEIIEDAPSRLAKAFKKEDFPTVEQITGFFEYSITFMPVPVVRDWRIAGLGDSEKDAIRSGAESKIRMMYDNATRTLFERAHTVLFQFAKQVESYGKPGHGIHAATLENLKEMAGLIVQMNVTGNPELTRLGYEIIEAVAGCNVETLRKDDDARKSVSATTARILERIKGNTGEA